MPLERKMHNYLDTTLTHKFYLGVATQSAAIPYGVIYKTHPGKDYTHSGSGLSESRMRCNCYGGTYHQVKTMAIAVINSMETWPASEGGVQAVFLNGETDSHGDKSHSVALDFVIWHTL